MDQTGVSNGKSICEELEYLKIKNSEPHGSAKEIKKCIRRRKKNVLPGHA